MAALPVVSKTYSARGNVPHSNNATALGLAQSNIWQLKEHMKDTMVGGALSGTRHANSVWTVMGSSNSTVAAMDAVDRWTTFANLIWAANNVAHSWIVLRNTTLGYEVCLDCNPATSASMGFAVAEIATPFTGGTTLTRPTAANEFCMGNTATGAAATFTHQSDVSTGNFNWTHYITADDGQFYFLCSRTGLGVFSTFMGLQKSVGQGGGDVRNVFAMGHALSTGRGAPNYTTLIAASGCTARLQNGGANTLGGMMNSGSFGASNWAGSTGIDSVTGNYLAFQLHLAVMTATQPSYRGYLPDQYAVAAAPVGGAIPSAAAQERLIVGDFIVPFPGVNPII